MNTLVIHRAGLLKGLGQLMASGEGIQDKLHRNPTKLFQTDEIDGLLQSINKSKDARHESIMNTMLTMYSSANSMYPMRTKAGSDESGVIDQPCLIVYGTAIPTHYYAALSERMLTNGFLARMIVVECPKRCPGQEPKILVPTDRLVDTANHWGDLGCGWGNLNHEHPDPLGRNIELAANGVAVTIRASRFSDLCWCRCPRFRDLLIRGRLKQLSQNCV